MKKIFFLLMVCILFFAGNQDLLAQDTTGTFSGRVSLPEIKKEQRTFRGRVYRNRLSAKKQAKQKSETLQSPYIDVIIILKPLTHVAKTEPIQGVKIVQKNAEFIPRVVPVTRNTVVQFINFDKFYHNVFSVTPGARFNLGRRPTGTVVEHKIERPGEIKLFCDIHAQMNATILSLDTPYFTRVQTNGTYKLNGLPAGDYLVQVYHPDLPDLEEQVSIRSEETTSRIFTLRR